MPELVEVETYRRLAEALTGRRIAGVDAPDPWFLKRGTTADALSGVLVGTEVVAARRIGKLLLLDVSAAPATAGTCAVLGLRFGMTGRLLVDGRAGVDDLVYGSNRDEPAWDRFALELADGGRLVLRDPRRLGGVELDPDTAALGPDALGIGRRVLAAAMAGSAAPVKARLMDQSRVAGVGNLIADEALWRAGIDPARAAGSLSDAEVAGLQRALARTLRLLLARGGSHAGDLMAERVAGGRCPLDGVPLVRRTIGGRTTWSCPVHQR